MTKRWVQVPRNKEGPEPVYLAKVPDRPRKRGDVEIVETVEATAVMTVRRRVPPPKRKAKPRGRKPGPKKTVSFAEERLRTFPVVIPHNSDPNAPGGPTPGGIPIGTVPDVAVVAAVIASGDTDMVDVDAATTEESAPINEVAVEVEKKEIEEEKAALAQKVDELPKKPVPAPPPAGPERKAHPLPPRPAGLPPKPVGAANLVNSGEHPALVSAILNDESKTPGKQ